MRTLVAATTLLILGALAPARAEVITRLGRPFPCPPAVVAPAYPVYPSGYYAPPAVIFNTWWDPDYRALRYNRYFQRYQDQPRIQGFTLR